MCHFEKSAPIRKQTKPIKKEVRMTHKNDLTPAEKWERATLADNFIFCKVMY